MSYTRLFLLFLACASLPACSTVSQVAVGPQTAQTWQRYTRVSPYANVPYSPGNIASRAQAVQAISAAGVEEPVGSHLLAAQNGVREAQAAYERAEAKTRQVQAISPAEMQAASEVGYVVLADGTRLKLPRAFGGVVGAVAGAMVKETFLSQVRAQEYRPVAENSLAVVKAEMTVYKQLGQPVPERLTENKAAIENYLSPAQHSTTHRNSSRPHFRVPPRPLFGS